MLHIKAVLKVPLNSNQPTYKGWHLYLRIYIYIIFVYIYLIVYTARTASCKHAMLKNGASVEISR